MTENVNPIINTLNTTVPQFESCCFSSTVRRSLPEETCLVTGLTINWACFKKVQFCPTTVFQPTAIFPERYTSTFWLGTDHSLLGTSLKTWDAWHRFLAFPNVALVKGPRIRTIDFTKLQHLIVHLLLFIQYFFNPLTGVIVIRWVLFTSPVSENVFSLLFVLYLMLCWFFLFNRIITFLLCLHLIYTHKYYSNLK